MVYRLAPSLLAADFASLGEAVTTVTKAGAHYIHCDIMDGHFVPNLSFGAPVLERIRGLTGAVFDVHLMISRPERYLSVFAQAGADILNVHFEAAHDILACINAIHALGLKAAVTIKPSTPISVLYPLVEQVEMILLMSVEPGFGGQHFIYETLRKAETLAQFIHRRGFKTEIEMDGGIDQRNVRSVLDAGVNVVVAGSAIFAKTNEETTQNVKSFLRLMTVHGNL